MAFLGGDSRSSASASNNLNNIFSPAISVLLGGGTVYSPAGGGSQTGTPSSTANSSGNDNPSMAASVPFLNGTTGNSTATDGAGNTPQGYIAAGQAYGGAGLGTTTGTNGAAVGLNLNSNMMLWLVIGGAVLMLSGSGSKRK